MSDSNWLFSLTAVTANLPPEAEPLRFAVAHRHGTMMLGIYAPRGPDIQTPHEQDELYIVATGSGVLNRNGERRAVAVSDVLFVEAGAPHRFEDLSEDFSAWVIFWGPPGGER
jgi:mannose-6-phosphate isomerase-like protein (cupin superfamily)